MSIFLMGVLGFNCLESSEIEELRVGQSGYVQDCGFNCFRTNWGRTVQEVISWYRGRDNRGSVCIYGDKLLWVVLCN